VTQQAKFGYNHFKGGMAVHKFAIRRLFFSLRKDTGQPVGLTNAAKNSSNEAS